MGGSQRGGTAAGAAVGAPAAIPAAGPQAQGWDLYAELLAAVCLLVTDPQPQVAACAAAVLRVADVELTVSSAAASGTCPQPSLGTATGSVLWIQQQPDMFPICSPCLEQDSICPAHVLKYTLSPLCVTWLGHTAAL